MLSKIFFKDLVTKKKVFKYLLGMVLFTVFVKLFLADFIKPIFQEAFLPWITFITIFTSTAYTIYTYSLFEKVKTYIMLPIKKNRFLLAFTIGMIGISFLERGSFLIIGALICSSRPIYSITIIILVATWSILINIWVLLTVNNHKKINWIIIATNFIMIFLAFNLISSEVFQLLILASGIIICFIEILLQDSISIAITHIGKRGLAKFHFAGNYFLKVIAYEKIYIVNSVMLIVMICLLSFMKGDNVIIWSLIWTIGATNTPVLTMMSSDLYVRRQAQMFPESNVSLWKMYCIFLMEYFLFINGLICVFSIFIIGKNPWITIPIALVLSVIEVIGAYILEKKKPILYWQTKQELWKNPRKYILSIIVFLLISSIYSATSIFELFCV
ncbi:hypothetical protein MSMTP_1787 [Methanosarcina sp. MTP4]|uniref:hypothetical protein n=1 Tax=Methanosarcina sp. MTP4 TaxID=1434100 RepID=UPI0006154AE3|nr:hypothetical protein [Methanosarcina sp. MTP4]AKB25256.1 hypothetical protein MSMTP_1787 [Methanosarcina sp. MTP4]